MTPTPYSEHAFAYRQAGWAGVLPLPVGEKSPPPAGYTGWAGVMPSGADVQAWIEGGFRSGGRVVPAGNIGLRLPEGVYGLDVDAYGEKDGAAALGELVEAYGALPDTWVITSRDDNVSGIRLFRAALPMGRRWRDEPAGHGRGIEAIHYGHRYAVTWPSVHPDTGRKYLIFWPAGSQWADPATGNPVTFPRVDDLPELPEAWVLGLSDEGEVATGDAASHEMTLAVVQSFRDSADAVDAAACERVREAAARGLSKLAEARDGAALHPAARDTTHELARLGHEGHAGARRALAEHFGAFLDVRGGRGLDRRSAEAEWWRLVRGAVGKLAGDRRAECDCALLSGAGVQFDYDFALGTAGTALGTAEEPASGGEGGAGGVFDPVASMRAELLTARQVVALPPPVPLVSGLLDMNTLAWLIGKSGSFKSFVALDVAAHVAAGKAWALRRVRRGRVVYVVAEGGSGMTLRVRAWETFHEQEMSDDVLFLPRPVQAKGPEWSTLVEVCRAERPVLIVVDTQARVTVGIEENSNTEMGQLVEQVDRLRRVCGACVLMVHHIGRNGEDARGASSIDGAQDTELKVERVGSARSMKARLVIDKQKDGADTAGVDFEMVRVEGGEDPDTGRDLSSLVVSVNDDPFDTPPARPWLENLPGNQGMIIDILADHFGETGESYARVYALVNERFGNHFKNSRMPKTSFSTAWQKLIKDEMIIRIEGTQRYKFIPPADWGARNPYEVYGAVRPGDETDKSDRTSTEGVRK